MTTARVRPASTAGPNRGRSVARIGNSPSRARYRYVFGTARIAGRLRAPPRVDAVTSSNGEPLVRLSGVNKWFGELHVLQDIDLAVARGEVVVVIGPSGRASRRCAGRSTGWSRSTTATIASTAQPLPEEGKELARLRADVGMVFQSLQPVRAQDGPARTSPSARSRSAGTDKAEAEERGRGAAGPGRASPTRPTSTRPSCPAASSSGSPSPGPWRWTPRSCSSTSRPRRSTPR